MFPLRTCILLLVIATGALASPYLNDYDRLRPQSWNGDNALRRLSADLRRVSDQVKRSRFAACIIFTPGSNCDHMELMGAREDEKHWRDNSPGRRRRAAPQFLLS